LHSFINLGSCIQEHTNSHLRKSHFRPPKILLRTPWGPGTPCYEKLLQTKYYFRFRWTSGFTWRTLTQPLTDKNQHSHYFVINTSVPLFLFRDPRENCPAISVAILVFLKPNLVYFAIVCFFCDLVYSLFFIFWFVFSFFKDVLRQVSTVFPAMIYVWFRRFKENLRKRLDSLLFLATVCSKISLYQQEQVLYNRWHVMQLIFWMQDLIYVMKLKFW